MGSYYGCESFNGGESQNSRGCRSVQGTSKLNLFVICLQKTNLQFVIYRLSIVMELLGFFKKVKFLLNISNILSFKGMWDK